MRRTWTIMAGMALLAGCATDGAPPPDSGAAPNTATTISYATQPCFGACPVYTVTVSADGRGHYTGERFTKVIGERDFTLDRATFDRFAATLAPYRPATGSVRYEMGSDNCGAAPTDMPSVDVRWEDGDAVEESLHFYLGCRRANPALAGAIEAAPQTLPIDAMIGKR
jgi:hypothetical protein